MVLLLRARDRFRASLGLLSALCLVACSQSQAPDESALESQNADGGSEGLEYREHPGPRYFHDRHQLETILEDLKAWLPGAWSSFPQVWYGRHVGEPAEGEHENWHRTFALIDAPQVGETVFYGQLNVGGPDGPLMDRTQVLYKTWIDTARGFVVINGQPIKNPKKFIDLHEKPELWHEVQMRDESAIRCDFLWYRQGKHIVGVLAGKTEERSRYGPGTCSYYSESSEAEFFADAEWVLTPEELWLYDINTMGGYLFVGRPDRRHLKLYRSRDYRCVVRAGDARTEFDAHDRGYEIDTGPDDRWLLLRAEYPAENGGLVDELRLIRYDNGEIAESVAAAPGGAIRLTGDQVDVSCGPAATQRGSG